MRYSKIARFYDIISYSWTFGRIKEIRNKIAELVPNGSKVLELGCGTGDLSKRIYKKVNCYLGLDSSDKMISLARKENSGHNINFQKEDIFNFNKFQNYDIIIASVFFCALPIKSLKILIKKLSEDFSGRVILYEEHTPNNTLIGTLWKYSRYSSRYLFYLMAGDPLEPIHDFKKLFLGNGFKLVEEHYFFNSYRCVLCFEI
ncbi:MAG: class I SAM-dependent methyltransferase [Candidatus Woesearchaeota archaeon]